ncbi:MAG: glycosyltransferase [Ruminococcaceae bacterium]|nr:glycosyltransferase [Oscillospiraceae bacterium]
MSAEISVIMGIYNCAATLPEAIDSIINQTYKNWELIMCDDGSSDDTYAVAGEYQKKYPAKIILIRNERNRGLNYTLNHCLKYATGKYIARMDGDDISLPNRFEVERNVLENEPEIAVVSTTMIHFDEEGDFSGYITCTEYPVKESLVHGPVHCHAPCIIRTEVMQTVGGYTEDKNLLRVEDWHLWLKIYALGHQGKNLSEPLYKMRDDRNAAERRRFRYRLNEARMVKTVIKTLRLPKWKYVFMLRPIIVGLLPKTIYSYLHRKKLKGVPTQ